MWALRVALHAKSIRAFRKTFPHFTSAGLRAARYWDESEQDLVIDLNKVKFFLSKFKEGKYYLTPVKGGQPEWRECIWDPEEWGPDLFAGVLRPHYIRKWR